MQRIIGAFMQRRHLFSLWSRAAAALAWQQVFAPVSRAASPVQHDWTESEDVFPLGVASGEPRPQSIVLWTRLAPKPLQADGGMPARPVPVTWELAQDQRFSKVLRTGVVLAEPDRGHSVHVEVDGLTPGQTYHYRFLAGGQGSPVGRTRTAPDPERRVGRLRLAMASCQHYEAGFFVAHREIAQSDIDLVVFLGDYIYETRMKPRDRLREHPHVIEHFDLADYRIHHASYKLDADLRASHAAHPWLMIWDDHDVLNDYAAEHSRAVPDRAHFLRIRTAAYRAYFEHLPVSPRRAPVGASMPMQDRYEWGQLAELWALDGRQFRSKPVCQGVRAPAKGRLLWQCDPLKAPQRSVLGQGQEEWLAESLAASTRDWKLILQPTQIAPSLFPTPAGPLVYSDGWDAFPSARERLLAAIAQPRVPDVVCLGGDVHRHVAANLRFNPADPTSPIIASELVTSSVSSRGMSEWMTQRMKAGNPDMLHARSDERGYALLDITPSQLTCDFRATPHPARMDARLRTQARYVVERGVPGPKRVPVR